MTRVLTAVVIGRIVVVIVCGCLWSACFNSIRRFCVCVQVTTTVHNIIVGKLWIDNHGEMEIVNHGTGDRCTVKFIPYSYFSRETPKRVSDSDSSSSDKTHDTLVPSLILLFSVQVTGLVKDKTGHIHYVVQGTWDKHIDMLKVTKVGALLTFDNAGLRMLLQSVCWEEGMRILSLSLSLFSLFSPSFISLYFSAAATATRPNWRPRLPSDCGQSIRHSQ